MVLCRFGHAEITCQSQAGMTSNLYQKPFPACAVFRAGDWSFLICFIKSAEKSF